MIRLTPWVILTVCLKDDLLEGRSVTRALFDVFAGCPQVLITFQRDNRTFYPHARASMDESIHCLGAPGRFDRHTLLAVKAIQQRLYGKPRVFDLTMEVSKTIFPWETAKRNESHGSQDGRRCASSMLACPFAPRMTVTQLPENSKTHSLADPTKSKTRWCADRTPCCSSLGDLQNAI